MTWYSFEYLILNWKPGQKKSWGNVYLKKDLEVFVTCTTFRRDRVIFLRFNSTFEIKPTTLVTVHKQGPTLWPIQVTVEGFRHEEQLHMMFWLQLATSFLPVRACVSSVRRQLFSHDLSPPRTQKKKTTNSSWMRAIRKGNEESSSVLHSRGEQTQEECERAAARRRANTPGESEKILERRATSQTSTRTVTGVLEAFFTSLFFFLPALKGCCVVNNTAALIHTGGPLCALWMDDITRGEINMRRGRIAAAAFFPVPVMASMMVQHFTRFESLSACWQFKQLHRVVSVYRNTRLPFSFYTSFLFSQKEKWQQQLFDAQSSALMLLFNYSAADIAARLRIQTNKN